MRVRTETDTAALAPEGRRARPPAYGAPSSDLLARADRGFARFLERIEDQDDGPDGSPDTPR